MAFDKPQRRPDLLIFISTYLKKNRDCRNLQTTSCWELRAWEWNKKAVIRLWHSTTHWKPWNLSGFCFDRDENLWWTWNLAYFQQPIDVLPFLRNTLEEKKYKTLHDNNSNRFAFLSDGNLDWTCVISKLVNVDNGLQVSYLKQTKEHGKTRPGFGNRIVIEEHRHRYVTQRGLLPTSQKK